MVDIDYFKAINDGHGHLMGDRVLAGAAACLASVADGKGSVYRYGGDEMTVVLPNYTIQEAIAVAERARREVESAKTEDLSVTASFGVSSFSEHGRSSGELLQAADKALYDAKEKGRNLVRVFGEPEPTPAGREPERKSPVSGALTDRQRKDLREQHFRGDAIRCPKDKATLRAEESREFTAGPRKLIITCGLCGLSEEI